MSDLNLGTSRRNLDWVHRLIFITRNLWLAIKGLSPRSFVTWIICSGAVLGVCMRKLVFYPEIVGFIEEEKEKFPTVKVNYAYNSPPKADVVG
ncbi:hypothetical protein ACET3Z_017580 [Daucus carota]